MPGWDSLLGQNELKGRLGRALKELPGHSFVFVGPDGIGKRRVALELGRAHV